MKTTNRLIAMLLALIMILSCAPMSVFAETTATSKKTNLPTSIADTYVSAANPDVVYGDSEELRLNGGDNENIILVTYDASVLKETGGIELYLSVSNDAKVNAEIFLVDNYTVNEEVFNYSRYKNEIKLNESLGKYTLVKGANNIKLTGLGTKVVGKTFTLVIKSNDENVHTYYLDFENYTKETELSRMSKAPTDANGNAVAYSSEFAIITNGSASGWRYHATQDPNDPSNNLMRITTGTTAGPRISLANTVSYYDLVAQGDKVMANGVDVTNKTYRFSAKAYINEEDLNYNSSDSFFFYAAKMKPAADEYYVKSESISLTAYGEWQDVSVDFSVTSEYLKDVDPAFGFFYGHTSKASGSCVYLDNIGVVELTADGKEMAAVISSKEVEVDNSAYGDVGVTAEANALSAYEFNAPKLSVIKNGAKQLDLVVLKKRANMAILSAEPSTGALIIGSNGTYYSLCDSKGNIIKLSETKTTPVAIVYNDNNGTARYFINEKIAYVVKDGETVPAVDLPIYNSAFAKATAEKICFEVFLGFYTDDTLIAGKDYAFAVHKINNTNDNAKIIAYQESTVSKGIRIIAGVDSLYYSNVGFEVEIVENGTLKKSETVLVNTVYSSILADKTTVTAKENGYNYFATLNISDVTANSNMKIRSFTEIAGVKHYDSIMKIDVTNDGYSFGALPDKEIFSGKQLVLLMGQSNMVGRGLKEYVEPVSDNRISVFKGNKWTELDEPIFRDVYNPETGKKVTAFSGNNSNDTNLSTSFAKAFVETFDCELGLVPVARGGSSIQKWQKGFNGSGDEDLYENAVAIAKEAQKSGEICAILWHQGCSNRSGDGYVDMFKSLMDNLIADLGLDRNQIVIITGEIGRWGTNTVNQRFHEIDAENYYERYGVASSEGLTNVERNGSSSHFDSPSLRVFGYRYFEQFYEELTDRDCTYEYSQNPKDYRIDPKNNNPEAEDTKDTTEYIAKIDFNELKAANYTAKTTLDNKAILNASTNNPISVIHQGTNIFATLTYNASGTPYITVPNSVGAEKPFAVELDLMIGETLKLNSKATLIELASANSTVKLIGLGMTAGTEENTYYFYDPVTGGQICKVPDFHEWTNVKIICDMINNKKDVYIDGTLYSLALYSNANAEYSKFATVSTKIADLGASASGVFSVDNYKCYLAQSYLANESFDGFTTGAIEIGATVNSVKFSGAADKAAYGVIEESGNKFVYFSSIIQSGGGYIDISNASKAGKDLTIEAKIKIAKYGDSDFAVKSDFLKLVNASSGGDTISLLKIDSTSLKSGDKVVATLSTTDWIDVKVVCHFSTNTKDVYINGVLKDEGATLNSKSTITPSTYATVKTRVFQHNKSGLGTIYIDDFRAYN